MKPGRPQSVEVVVESEAENCQWAVGFVRLCMRQWESPEVVFEH